MRLVMGLADRANEYVDRAQPWNLKKDPDKAGEVQAVCTVILNLYRQLVVYLTPVLPKLAEQTAELLGSPIGNWTDATQPLTNCPVSEFKHLMVRVDPKKIDAVVSASQDAMTQVKAAGAADSAEDDGAPLAAEPIAPECTIDDFTKLDLRVARVLAAEHVPDAKKLLKLTVSLGGGVTRTLFAGIKAAYEPDKLVGRLVIIAANLAPRKMKFGVSEGMVLAAGPGDKDVFLIAPDAGAKPGQRLH
jgi:methionyl-tRNA synthetase